MRDRSRGPGDGTSGRWGVPLDHERPDAHGAGVVAGVQGAAGDREAVRAAQDGFRGGARVPQGGEPDSSTAVHVLLRTAGGVAPGAGASSSDGPYQGGEPAAVSRGSRLPLPDGSAVDRDL